MWEEIFYKIEYVNTTDNKPSTALISAPPTRTVDRIREILAEIHPEWRIVGIEYSDYKPISK